MKPAEGLKQKIRNGDTVVGFGVPMSVSREQFDVGSDAMRWTAAKREQMGREHAQNRC